MPDPTAIGDYPDAGIRVEYFEEPFRSYTVNGVHDHTWTPDEPFGLVPSVTTALGVLNKAALPNWAAKITREGCWKLIRMDRGTRYLRQRWGDRHGQIIEAISGGMPQHEACRQFDITPREYLNAVASHNYTLPHSLVEFTQSLKDYGLTHTQSTKAAAARGVDVHAVWENWNERKEIPDASKYPKDRRGYLRAMATFIAQHQPECMESEQVVGSAVHGFAGRLDTVVVLRTEDGIASMVDVKTSKSVYPNSHFPQLIGYEIARRECGLPPTERQGILRLGAEGDFELVWSSAEPDDFLSILAAWRSQQKWGKR